MRRTTLYLDADLDMRLRQEMRRQKRPMADLVRDAIRSYLGSGRRRLPPGGGGAFASQRKDTADRVDEALRETGFGKDV